MPMVKVRGGELYFEELGGGPSLVFMPGLGGDGRAFSVVSRKLSDRFRVLVFDPRDAGRSFRAVEGYTTRDMAQDLVEALEGLGAGPVHLVGHSLGGLVAQEFALARPEMVKSLLLASTHAGSNAWRQAVIASWIEMRKRTNAAEFSTMTLPWLVAPRFYHTMGQVEGLVRFAERNEWPQAPDAFERQATAAARHEARDRVGGISAPTLVVSGAEDLVNPVRVAQELSDLIPGSTLEVIEGAGHMPHIETGAQFREVVGRFLDRHS